MKFTQWYTEKFRDRFARLCILVLIGLVLYLVASSYRTSQELQKTNNGIVAKLTEVFTQAQKAEAAARAAGQVPTMTIEKITEGLRGYVSPELVQKAVEAAKAAVAGQVGPKGDTGPTGVKGAPGATGAQGTAGATGAVGAQGATGATGSPAVTATTARPVTTTTTTRPPVTTSTRPCTLVIPGLVKVGC